MLVSLCFCGDFSKCQCGLVVCVCVCFFQVQWRLCTDLIVLSGDVAKMLAKQFSWCLCQVRRLSLDLSSGFSTALAFRY